MIHLVRPIVSLLCLCSSFLNAIQNLSCNEQQPQRRWGVILQENDKVKGRIFRGTPTSQNVKVLIEKDKAFEKQFDKVLGEKEQLIYEPIGEEFSSILQALSCSEILDRVRIIRSYDRFSSLDRLHQYYKRLKRNPFRYRNANIQSVLDAESALIVCKILIKNGAPSSWFTSLLATGQVDLPFKKSRIAESMRALFAFLLETEVSKTEQTSKAIWDVLVLKLAEEKRKLASELFYQTIEKCKKSESSQHSSIIFDAKKQLKNHLDSI